MKKDIKSYVIGNARTLLPVIFLTTFVAPITLGFFNRCFGPVGKIGWRVWLSWFDWNCGLASFAFIHAVCLIGSILMIVITLRAKRSIGIGSAWLVVAMLVAAASAWSFGSTMFIGLAIALFANGSM